MMRISAGSKIRIPWSDVFHIFGSTLRRGNIVFTGTAKQVNVVKYAGIPRIFQEKYIIDKPRDYTFSFAQRHSSKQTYFLSLLTVQTFIYWCFL